MSLDLKTTPTLTGVKSPTEILADINKAITFSKPTEQVAQDFNSNTNVAQWRKAKKLELMSQGMNRREAKNKATLMANLNIQALGKDASQSQKDWMNARAKLYTVDSNGNITRNKSNFWNTFGTIMGGLTLGPTGAFVANQLIPRHLKAAPTTNWGTSTLDSIKPSQLFLDAEARIKLAVSQKTPIAQEAPTAQATPTVGNSDGTPVVAVKPPVAWENSFWGSRAKTFGMNTIELVKALLQKMKDVGMYKGEVDGKWGTASSKAYLDFMDLYTLGADGTYIKRPSITLNTSSWHSGLPKGGTLNDNTYTINNFAGNKGQTMTFMYDPTTKNISYSRNLGNGTSLKGNWINGKYQRSTRGVSLNNHNIRFKNGIGLDYTGWKYRIGTNGQLLYNNSGEWMNYPNKNYTYFKKGGKFQQGGSMTQEDLQEQLLTAATLGMIGYANANQKAMDFTTAVSQVMELALTKPETLQEIASNEELVKAGIEIMKQLEPEVLQMVSKPGGLRKILAQLKNKTKMAKQGSKLEYIQKLRGICPEGYEMSYMKAGGKVCPVCKKKSKKAQNGTKMLDNGMPIKKMGGAISDLMNEIKTSLFQNGGKTTQTKPQYKAKDTTVYQFPDSATYQKYLPVLQKFDKEGKLDNFSDAERKLIAEANKFTISSPTE